MAHAPRSVWLLPRDTARVARISQISEPSERSTQELWYSQYQFRSDGWLRRHRLIGLHVSSRLLEITRRSFFAQSVVCLRFGGCHVVNNGGVVSTDSLLGFFVIELRIPSSDI